MCGHVNCPKSEDERERERASRQAAAADEKEPPGWRDPGRQREVERV